MSNSPEIFKLHYYLELLLRRRWFIIIPFSLSMIIGIYLAFTLPKIYSAQTLILVEPQRVPSNYVQSIVFCDINSRISTISQQIMSRTNIEKIINQFKLFSDPTSKGMYLEDKVGSVRKRISVKVTRATRQGADSFSIGYKGGDPRVVMNVANTLATFVIDENLKAREAQAVGTSDFLENERMSMLKRLEEVEKTLTDYRTKYMGELPEQLESNLSILSRLEEQRGLLQQRRSEAEGRLIVFESQAAESRSLPTVPGIAAQPGRQVQPESNEVVNLNRLKAQLTELQNKYTDHHPDVIRQKSLISELEAKLAEKPDEPVRPPEQSVSQPALTPAQTAQGRQIDAIKREMKALEAEISGIRHQIKVYQNRVEVTPKREQELMSLNRDYGNILAAYNSLINRKLEAEISVNMEKKQKGEQFRIVDPAVLPQKPISPDMKRLFLLVIGAGLGIGCGLIFLLDYMDASFKGVEEVESLIGVPVIVTLPLIIHPQVKRRQTFKNILSIFSIMISLGLLAGFAGLTFMGIERTKVLLNKLLMVMG